MFSHLRVLLPPSLPLGRHPLLKPREEGGREGWEGGKRKEEWKSEREKGHEGKDKQR